MNNKNNFFSTAKGIGIILMVMGHCGAPDLFTKFIYQFHMPLFFICSGYFLKDINNLKTLFQTYIKKIKGIYIKFALWSIIFLSLHNFFFSINIYNDIVTFHGQPSYQYTFADFYHKAVKIIITMNEHEQLVRSFWFLKQLFLASIIVPLLILTTNKISNKRKSHLIALCLLFSTTFISKSLNWFLPAIWDISLVFMSCSFYISGYIFRKYNIMDYTNKKEVSIMCIIFSFIGLFSLPWTNMLEYTPQTLIPFYIVAFSGTILIMNISKMIETQNYKYITYYIGQNTMVIFALHMLCFKIGNLLKIAIYNYPIYRLAEFQIIEDHNTYFWTIYTILGIGIPLLIDYYLKQNKITNKIWNIFV